MLQRLGPTLRQRKKAAAMRHIQTVAVAMFTERGFDAVTVEQVAAAADVSPSTVYRYFGTKEGLIVHDEYDDELLAMAAPLLEVYDPVTAFLVAVERLQSVSGPALTEARWALWFAVPSVRAAGYLMIDEFTDELATILVASGRSGLTLAQARTLIGALLGATLTSLRTWVEDGAVGDPIERLCADLTVVRAAFPPA
ncbi:MAG: TetR family transcriptional regulator [Dermatophilaceae bacterium]